MTLVVVFIVVNRVFRIEKALQTVALQGFFVVEVIRNIVYLKYCFQIPERC